MEPENWEVFEICVVSSSSMFGAELVEIVSRRASNRGMELNGDLSTTESWELNDGGSDWELSVFSAESTVELFTSLETVDVELSSVVDVETVSVISF